MRSLLFFLYLVLVSGCTVTKQELDPKIYYIHDLQIKANGKWFKGMGVIKKSNLYKFKINSPGQMTTLLIQTCHRQIKIHDAGKKEKINFYPNPEENNQSCGLIRFSAFDKKRGKHAQAIIWVDMEKHKLKSKVYCNGSEVNYLGVSTCHALEGLYQRVTFEEEVTLYEEDKNRCKITNKNLKRKNKEFRFVIKPRECKYIFKSKSGQTHFMYTSGYEQNIIRN